MKQVVVNLWLLWWEGLTEEVGLDIHFANITLGFLSPFVLAASSEDRNRCCKCHARHHTHEIAERSCANRISEGRSPN